MGTPRLVELTDDHVPALLQTMRDPETLRFTRTSDPVTDAWLEQWRARFDGRHRLLWAVVDGPEDDPEFVGYAVTGPVDREELEVELGYAVAPWARGRGVATAVLQQMARWAFDEGMQRVTALISVQNPASQQVARRAGFTFEGVLRSRHHVDGRRVDLQSWSILPGELKDRA